MREFKGLPVCKKHGIAYHWKSGCKICKKYKVKSKEKILDKALREMREKDDKNINNDD